jgi:hypothetical protein
MAEDYGQTPVNNSGLATAHAAGIVVVGALFALIFIRRGFRGVNVLSAGVSVR